MEFSDITDGFASVAKKVTSTVDDAVVSPLENVTSTVTGAFVGPNLDLLPRLTDLCKQTLLMEKFHTDLLAWGRALRKEKFSQPKRKKILAFFKEVEDRVHEKATYEESTKALRFYMDASKKEFQEGRFITSFEGQKIKSEKKNTLTKTEKLSAITTFEAFQIEVSKNIRLFDGSLEGIFMVPSSSSFSHQKLVDVTKNTLKGAYSTGLDKEFTLVSAWKELSRLTGLLGSHTKKIEKLREKEGKSYGPEKTSYQEAIKNEEKKMGQLLKDKITSHLKYIERLEREIDQNEQKIGDAFSSYTASVSENLSNVRSSVERNMSESGKVYSTTQKQKKSLLTTSKKSILSAKKEKDILVKSLDGNFDQIDQLKAKINSVRDAENIWRDAIMSYEAGDVYQGYSVVADVEVASSLLAYSKEHLFTDLDLYREHMLHVQLGNRVKQRHVTLVKSVWNKLLDLKKTNEKLFSSLVTTLEKKTERYTKRIDTSKALVEERKKSVDLIKANLWDTVKYETLMGRLEVYTKAMIESHLMEEYASYLQEVVNQTTPFIKSLATKLADAEKAIKKSHFEVEEKEKTSKTVKKTAQIRKDLKDLHEKEHTQEIYASLLHKFHDEVEENLAHQKELIVAYKKASSKKKKEAMSLKKSIKSLQKKLKKSGLAKEVLIPDVLTHKNITY